jgi:hypothetical protein
MILSDSQVLENLKPKQRLEVLKVLGKYSYARTYWLKEYFPTLLEELNQAILNTDGPDEISGFKVLSLSIKELMGFDGSESYWLVTYE